MERVFTHKELVQVAYRWVLKNASCGVAFKELVSASTSEIADVIGFGSGGHSVLVEVKVSRADFLCDKKKPFRVRPELGMGSQRWYCCPEGMIKVSELPEMWGLIYVNEKGKAVVAHHPYLGRFLSRFRFEKNKTAELSIMYSALRRLQVRGRIEEIYEDLER